MGRDLKEQIILLEIKKIKEAIKAGRVQYINRDKNMDTMLRLGLSWQDIGRVLLNLRSEDYHEGPEKDRDGSPGTIWVFIHPVSGCPVYVKLKVYAVDDVNYLKVLSFHD